MRLGSFWNEDHDHPLFVLNRNQRRDKLRDIVIEAMRRIAPQPLTKAELRKVVRIRKKTFLPMLKYLVDIGIVVRSGMGSKGEPFKYELAEHYRR